MRKWANDNRHTINKNSHLNKQQRFIERAAVHSILSLLFVSVASRSQIIYAGDATRHSLLYI